MTGWIKTEGAGRRGKIITERQRKAFKSLKKESNLKSKKQRKILKYIIIVNQMRWK